MNKKRETGDSLPEIRSSGRKHIRTPLIRINWDGEPFGFAENPDNWTFL